MIYFNDEFEYTTEAGKEVYVSVEGHLDEGSVFLDTIDIIDTDDNTIEQGDEDYYEITDVAYNRDYEVEEDARDFDHYEHDFNNFLRE